MSEFIVKTAQEWHSATESLPDVGKTVEVLAVMIIKASLVGTDPKQLWNQEGNMDDAHVEVKLWRECDVKE